MMREQGDVTGAIKAGVPRAQGLTSAAKWKYLVPIHDPWLLTYIKSSQVDSNNFLTELLLSYEHVLCDSNENEEAVVAYYLTFCWNYCIGNVGWILC